MAPYGLGYGLGKIGEGLSSGLLQGTMTGINLEMQKRKDDQALRIAQGKEAGLERRHGETIQSREQIAEANRKIDTLSKGMDLGIKSFNATKDPKFATEIFKKITGQDLPIQWPEKETDEYIVVPGGDVTYLIPKDGKIIADIAGKVPLDNKLESFQEALKSKGILTLPKGSAPMTEAQKKEYGPGGFKEQEIKLKKEEIGVKEGKEAIKNEAGARKRISEIEKERVNVKAKGVTPEILNLVEDPNAKALLAGFMGQKLKPEDLVKVNEAFDAEIEFLTKKYLPTSKPGEKGFKEAATGEELLSGHKPNTSLVAVEMKKRGFKPGKYKVEGNPGTWDGTNWKWD